MKTERAETTNLPLAALREQLSGRVIVPSDADYETARVVMPGIIDRHPAVIVRVAKAADVVLAIAFARENGLEIAVRSGGHSIHGTTDGGLVIDVRDMKALDIDPAAGTCWAETGLTAAELTAAAWEHGLTIGFGDTGSVGIGGITLGGGIGYMVRKHGLTIDNLLAAEIVTADGSVLTVDEADEPDLSWAIRGGGGNFGVATRFKFKLTPMDSFVGGMLVLPATADVVAGFMAAAAEAPEELSTIANVMPCPPMPFLPEDIVGKVVVLALMGFCGDAQAGERAMAPFRALAQPLADFVKQMRYPEMYQEEDDSYHPKALDYTFFMDRVDRATAQTVIDRLEASDASLRAVQLRPLGGAMSRVPAEATAFAHRNCRILAVAVNFFEGEDDFAQRRAWLDETVEALRQDVPGAYVNFLRDESEERLSSAYPDATWDRLADIKARFDPDNDFRLNTNISPQAAG